MYIFGFFFADLPRLLFTKKTPAWHRNGLRLQYGMDSGPTQTTTCQTNYSPAHLRNLEPSPPRHGQRQQPRDWRKNERVQRWARNSPPVENTLQASWEGWLKESLRNTNGNILPPPPGMWQCGRGGVGARVLPRRRTPRWTCLFVQVAIRCTTRKRIWIYINHFAMALWTKTTRDPQIELKQFTEHIYYKFVKVIEN